MPLTIFTAPPDPPKRGLGVGGWTIVLLSTLAIVLLLGRLFHVF